MLLSTLGSIHRIQVGNLGEEATNRSGIISRASYLAGVDAFVEQIDGLVGLLESVAEGRIDTLRLIQAVSLVLTIAIVHPITGA